MSASFPNSWEPYGSSQQSQALGWRKPATRPANQPTLSDRWKNAHAKVLQSSILPSRPTPSIPTPAPTQPKPKSLGLASFQHAEHEHRILARYESVRTEVRQVASSVKQLSTALDASRDHHDAANKALHDETASLHGAVVTIREKIAESAKNHITENQVKDIVQQVVMPLTKDIHATPRALENLEDSYNRLRKDVNCLTNSLFDRLAKHIGDDIRNLISRQLIPILDQRIQNNFDHHIENCEVVMDRMEDRIKILAVSYGRELLESRSQSPFDGHFDERDYEQESLYRRGAAAGYVTRSRGGREGLIRGQQHQRVAHDGEVRDYRRIPDSRPGTKATDFDVVAREDRTERRPAPDRAPAEVQRTNRGSQRTSTPRPSMQDRNSVAASPVWAKLRVRPSGVVEKATTGSKLATIDLTRIDDSDGEQETSLFEESALRHENVAKKSPKLHSCPRSKERNFSRLEPNAETDTNTWSPNETEEAYKTATGTKAYRGRHKSPYFTRSAKRRRRRG